MSFGFRDPDISRLQVAFSEGTPHELLVEAVNSSKKALKKFPEEIAPVKPALSYFPSHFGTLRTPEVFYQSLDPKDIEWATECSPMTGHLRFDGLEIDLYKGPDDKVTKVSGVYHQSASRQSRSSGAKPAADAASAGNTASESSTASATNTETARRRSGARSAALREGTTFTYEDRGDQGLEFICQADDTRWVERRPKGGETKVSVFTRIAFPHKASMYFFSALPCSISSRTARFQRERHWQEVDYPISAAPVSIVTGTTLSEELRALRITSWSLEL